MITERRTVAFALCIIPFVALATLNSGGYRYGASDQAFYLPAVFLQLDPELFPRDAAVLAAQTRLTLVDEAIAAVVALTSASVPAVFFVLYVAALVLLARAVWQIGVRLYTSHWTAVALLAALTLRHAIARSGTNTLEGYFHPRVLAFALGATAIAAFLRGRIAMPFALVAIAGVLHPTTALWLLVWLTVAAAIARRELRKPIVVAAAGAAAAGLWALTAGPLAGRFVIMDPEWRQTLATKDYLFPLEWPAYAWILNLGYLPLIAWIYRRRVRAGLVDTLERALVLGSGSLVLIFVGALVLHAIGVAIAIQLQPARVFWMFDFLATIYMVWAIAEDAASTEGVASALPGPSEVEGRRKAARARAAAVIILCLSAARGVYVLIEADRQAVQITIPDDDWGRVMAYARSTDKRSGWLAHPNHAVLYGSSVRVAGARDVFVEAIKDAAIGMYDRPIALRTARRLAALPNYDQLTTAEAKRLAAEYDLNFIVTGGALDLPLAFESGPLRVYRLQ